MQYQTFALSEEELKSGIVPVSSNTALTTTESGMSTVDYILAFVRDSIFALMALIAIAMFLFI